MKTPIVLLCALATVGACLAAGDGSQPVRSICTVGVAEKSVAPDRAHLHLEIDAVAPTFEQSGAKVDATLEKLKTELKKHRIPGQEISVLDRTMDDRYEWRAATRSYVGKACTQAVEVVVRELGRLNEIHMTLATIENLELRDTEFKCSREGEIKREALLMAAEAARGKAEALAKASGVKITGLLELTEEDSSQGGWWGSSLAANRTVSEENSTGGARQTVRVTVRASYMIE